MGLKIHLCCGTYAYPDWRNLDQKGKQLGPLVRQWEWGQPICDEHERGTVDAVLTCYAWMYLPSSEYMTELDRIHDALRPGGLLVAKEDDERRRTWGTMGHDTGAAGIIRSRSTPVMMAGLMELVGFRVWHGYRADFAIVLDTHTRARPYSYILTGEKP